MIPPADTVKLRMTKVLADFPSSPPVAPQERASKPFTNSPLWSTGIDAWMKTGNMQPRLYWSSRRGWRALNLFCDGALKFPLLPATLLLFELSSTGWAQQRDLRLTGRATATDGKSLPGVTVTASGTSGASSDASGQFLLLVPRGATHLAAHVAGYAAFQTDLDMESDQSLDIELRPDESITVHAGSDVLAPDPSTSAYTRDDLLPANPGRPGIPLSVPGFPTETASGGIKAPQYFAPGVAGDHGEPIAQFFQVGNFLFENNLTANAHGNGYSDPNIVVPSIIGGVQVDNAAFNARYGDHSVNLAVDYTVRDQVAPFVELTSDGRDGDVSAAWSAAHATYPAWVAAEMSFGNGFLARPEEREQYKLNALRAWTWGNHELTIFGDAYYGFSRVPGLIPLHTPVIDDTIDPRQKDLTHTTIAIATDTWRPSERQQLTLSAFNRTYSLALDSDFGLGLIEQSERRTVQGANATWTHKLSGHFNALAGFDYRREAPRNLDLAHADAQGVLQLVTSNNLTITDYGPFAALEGDLGHSLKVYAGIRRDEIPFANADKITAANSYMATPGTTSPKITATWGEEDGSALPQVSLSFGKAFHANDPRIGSGTAHGALITQSREYQLVAAKVIEGTEVRLTLAHQTNSEELANIDPDTGLQQNTGPSLNRYYTLMARRRYSLGFLQASYSQANATDLLLHQPVPEAPRLIVDGIGTIDRLPFHAAAKAEYEYVGEKPLGDSFRGVPVQEIRLNLEKPFGDGRWIAAMNGELSNGDSGQTLETLALPGEPAPLERIVGVPLRSYGSISLRYQFKH